MSQGVLIIEDDDTQAHNIRVYLERRGYVVRTVGTGEAGVQEMRAFGPDAVLLDYQLPAGDGIETLRDLMKIDRRCKVIMVTAHGSLDIAVEAIRLGAHDYIEKPVAMSALAIALENALGHRRLEGEVEYYHSVQAAQGGMQSIVGRSPKIVALRAQIERLLKGEQMLNGAAAPNVLIQGETGTGKELIARALHFEGARAQGPWVLVSCARISRDAFELELFGSDSAADRPEGRRIGLLEAANGGTLFLDEVAELPREVQTQLLQALETRSIRRIGGSRDRKLDIRVIASTNRHLRLMTQTGEFRSDLYFRLNEVSLTAPPLRERPGDLAALASCFLEQSMRRYGRSNLSFTDEARSVMSRYDWRGNVRELRNAIDRAVMLTPSARVQAHHLGLEDDEIEESRENGRSDRLQLPEDGVKLEDVENDLIAQAMERTGGNVSKAARLLGLTRDTLRYRLSKMAHRG